MSKESPSKKEEEVVNLGPLHMEQSDLGSKKKYEICKNVIVMLLPKTHLFFFSFETYSIAISIDILIESVRKEKINMFLYQTSMELSVISMRICFSSCIFS